MSSGMNKEKAQEYANSMSFTSAVYNAIYARCVPYRLATKIKLNELLEIAKDVDLARKRGCDEVDLSLFYNGWNQGYEKAVENFKEKMCNLNQLNCFIDYVGDEIDLEELMHYASEEIAEQILCKKEPE